MVMFNSYVKLPEGKVEAPVVRAKKLKTKQWAGLSALKGCTITAVLSAALGCPRGIDISYGQWHMYIGDLP